MPIGYSYTQTDNRRHIAYIGYPGELQEEVYPRGQRLVQQL